MPEIFRPTMKAARPAASSLEFVRLQPEVAAPRPPTIDEVSMEAEVSAARERMAGFDRARGSRLVQISEALQLAPVIERASGALTRPGDTASIGLDRPGPALWLFGAEVVRPASGSGSFFNLYTSDAAAAFWLKSSVESGRGVYVAEIHTSTPGVRTTVSVSDGSSYQAMVATPGSECLRVIFEVGPTAGFILGLRREGPPLKVFRVDVTRMG